MKKSWRTTAFGVSTILLAVLAAAQLLLDGNPATNPDFNLLLTQVLLGASQLYAKDAAVTGGTVPATPEAVERLGG